MKRGIHYGPYSLLTSRDASKLPNFESRWKTGAESQATRNEESGQGPDTSTERLHGDDNHEYLAMAYRGSSKRGSSNEHCEREPEYPAQAIRVRKDVVVSDAGDTNPIR